MAESKLRVCARTEQALEVRCVTQEADAWDSFVKINFKGRYLFFCDTIVQNVSVPNGMRRFGVYHKTWGLPDQRAAYCCRVQDVIVGSSTWVVLQSNVCAFMSGDGPLTNTSYRLLGKTYARFSIMVHGGFVCFMRLLKGH